MTTLYFNGQAPAVAQVTKITPANVEIGDIFTLTVGRKAINVTATAATVANVVNLFIDAIGDFNNAIPEWAEISASAGTDPATGETLYLVLTGKDDGTPFTVTTGVANNALLTVTITVLQSGSAAQNEKQRVTLPGPPGGGHFTLTFAGATTASTAIGATGATVQGNLEALATIGTGNVSVVKNAVGDFTVEFIGTLAALRQPLITGNDVDMTAACSVIVSTTRQGRPASYAKGPVYTLTIVQPVDSFRFKFVGGAAFPNIDDYFSDFVANGTTGATADAVRIALEGIRVPVVLSDPTDADNVDTEPGVAPVYTLVDVTGPVGGPFNIVLRDGMQSALNASDHLEIDTATIFETPGVLDSSATSVDLTLVSAASTAGISEQQAIYLTSGPTGGTFTLTFEGQTTAAIAYNANGAAITSALVALSNIGATDVSTTGTGTRYDPWIVTFAVGLANTAVQQMTGDGASLTGATPTVEVIQDAQPGTNESQQVSITGGVPTGGTFTLTFNAETTSSLNYNATALEVKNAIEALATPIVGDIQATGGPLPGTPIVVEFQQSYASTNVSLMTATPSLTASNTQTLTGPTSLVSPTGPNWLDNAANYSTGSLPIAGDILIFANNAINVYWGLIGLSGLTLAELHIKASYTGHIGLTLTNPANYVEYRRRAVIFRATKTFVGVGEGQGSEFVYIDFSSVVTELIVYSTGQSIDNNTPALCVLGTNASNVMRFFKGSWGIGYFSGDTSVLATLTIGYINDRQGDSTGVVGADTDLDAVNMSGGTNKLTLEAAAAGAITVTGGILTIEGSQNVGSLVMSGEAYVYYNTTGTLGGNTILSDDAVLDFSQDMRTKTITNPIDVYGRESKVLDVNKVVTSLVIDYNYSDCICNGSTLGNNVRITRSTPS